MDVPGPLSPSLRGRPQAAPLGPRTRIVSSSRSHRESTQFLREAAPVYTPPDSETKLTLPTVVERIHEANESQEEITRSTPPPPSSPSIQDTTLLNVKAVPRVAALTPPSPNQIRVNASPVEGIAFGCRAMDSGLQGTARDRFARNSNALPDELTRLDNLKSVTQSKYRFTVQRRTMLLQALQSFSSYHDKEGISKLTSQLAQTTNECDQLLGELLQIADQIAQIHRLQDTHSASALAIALRKLNSSYGRRTADLLKSKEKIRALEAELGDAWQQAEKLAKEMDELEVVSDDDEAVIEVAEVVSLNHRKSPSGSSGPSLQRSLGEVIALSQPSSPIRILSSPSPTQTRLPSPSLSELEALPETPLTIAIPLTDSRPSDTTSLRSTKSIKSTKSTKSIRSTRITRSQRTIDTSRVSSVSAARRRSQRTSSSSLRMPSIRSAHKKGSHPPVPSLPSSTSPSTPDRRSSRVESFLDFGSRDVTDEDTDETESPMEQSAIEDIQVVARTPPPLIQTQDDIHVMPSRSAAERDLVATLPSQFSLDRQHPFANEESVNHSIPSMWLLRETPTTIDISERGESPMRDRGHVKGSLQRLKSLTKRYSLPFGPAAIQARSKSARNVTGL
ncbi:hypothetical protein MIND_00319800 [Mycena indigotica]|uniref:Uncharacterized protein n=1 Tax=Mycena indigotica TaxID=2126181 RepID=A0A8H6T4X7_9AGAR|nr:uncharacterized protein MIND_00319800 [Mycena indigotica]KAF7309490.1 hypothetical protein MIND_00319800 [Mycena indigotica]